jgi:acetate kinase
MNILLLNAGSSSLQCTLVEAAGRKEIAHALADWAGSVTHYQFAGPDGREHYQAHLERIVDEARRMVNRALGAA